MSGALSSYTRLVDDARYESVELTPRGRYGGAVEASSTRVQLESPQVSGNGARASGGDAAARPGAGGACVVEMCARV